MHCGRLYLLLRGETMFLKPECNTCRLWDIIGGGDYVDYGATRVQLPIEEGCRDGHDEEYPPGNMVCPFYEERPKCPKHGCYISRQGCDQCEWEREKELEQELEDEHDFFEMLELKEE